MTQARYFGSGEVAPVDYYHYGLASPIYTHFTSPIRRYVRKKQPVSKFVKFAVSRGKADVMLHVCVAVIQDYIHLLSASVLSSFTPPALLLLLLLVASPPPPPSHTHHKHNPRLLLQVC
jgi:hypothetical protein